MRESSKSDSSGAFPRVGRYEILLDLFDEGFVSLLVAKVRGASSGPRIVELSRVEHALAREIEVKEAFLAEARAAGRVRHPNFVHPIDALVHEGDLFGATEFALGARLDELRRVATAEHFEIPLSVSLRIVCDVLVGLTALHARDANTAGSRALVHGDVAPTNILITDRGVTRLVHSGLSSATNRAGAIGPRNHRLSYKAPEQLRTGVNAVPIGPAADVFAVGVLLWEALEGARLFDDPSDVEVVEHILYGQIPPHDPAGGRYMPIALLPLVANALERNPDVRTPNAATLLDAIERAPGVRIADTDEVAVVIERLVGPLIERRSNQIDELVARSNERPSDGSLRPVAGPQHRFGSMRTPVGFVYPPPSSSPPSPRSVAATSDAAPDVRASSPRPSSDSRIALSHTPPRALASRAPASLRNHPSRTAASARPVGGARSRRPASGGGWAYYVALGAMGGIAIFLLLKALSRPSASLATASPSEGSLAAPPPVVPDETVAAGSHDPVQPSLEPASLAPAPQASAGVEHPRPASTGLAAPPAATIAPNANAPSTKLTKPQPAPPTKAPGRSDIPEGI